MVIGLANGIVDLELRTLTIALNSVDKWSIEMAMSWVTLQQWKNDGAIGDVRDLFRVCL